MNIKYTSTLFIILFFICTFYTLFIILFFIYVLVPFFIILFFMYVPFLLSYFLYVHIKNKIMYLDI